MPRVLIKYRNAPVAQRTEQRSSKPKVVGSNPAGGVWVGVLGMSCFLISKTVIVEFPPLEKMEENFCTIIGGSQRGKGYCLEV